MHTQMHGREVHQLGKEKNVARCVGVVFEHESKSPVGQDKAGDYNIV